MLVVGALELRYGGLKSDGARPGEGVFSNLFSFPIFSLAKFPLCLDLNALAKDFVMSSGLCSALTWKKCTKNVTDVHETNSRTQQTTGQERFSCRRNE